MSRLIVASNRVADVEKAVQSGGLAVALGAALQRAHGVWFGWDGTINEDDAPCYVKVTEQQSLSTATLPLSRRDYEDYYLGFSNKILWPAFHYRLDLCEFEASFVEGYRKVNRKMAEALAPLIGPDDLIWVHDYHLIPLAEELRNLGIRQRIGFFLHIPFPSPEIVLAVPEHAWLIESLFAYDLIGFQTASDTANFIHYVTQEAGATVSDDDRVHAYGRSVTAKAFPIGIDAESVHQMAHSAEADAQIARLQRRSMANTFVIGVDRLDYTKGLPARMRAFRRLLEMHPELTKAVTLMQIAPPTREEVEAYTDIRQELEGLSGAINGAFGDFDWTPVRYIHRALPRSTLAALFRGCRVGLVTPLRDGMNLVAKEYVAAQDEDDPGVLILSKFAGAAEQLKEAIIVNPYDVDEMAAALHRGLVMSLDERRERYRALAATIREHDVESWRKGFLEMLSASGAKAIQ